MSTVRKVIQIAVIRETQDSDQYIYTLDNLGRICRASTSCGLDPDKWEVIPAIPEDLE